MSGYIYTRKHESYKHTLKLGETLNIPDRDSLYVTGELNRGQFTLVIKMNSNKIKLIEKIL